jgi:hypothetical protein
MANPNGRKGAAFEIAVRDYLRRAGVFVERLVKNGKNDEGDLVCVIAGETFILELKNRKKLDLPQFWREAVVEAENYGKARDVATPISYVIIKRRNAPIEQAWVVETLDQWLKRSNGLL